ncbi:MAG: metal-sulfur cluster assembly factor [Rhodospirillales bacterium]|nr:metal-sulfur cluster assembly factor [Rhodospirillales bacterium]
MTALEREAWRRLASVIDPETGLSVVDLGLIYDLRVAGEGLGIRMTLTHESCPLGKFLVEAVRDALAPLCPAGALSVSLSFDPRWSPERITAAGRAALRT